MADLQTCLKFSVGLSTKDCPCLETDRPEDYNKSLSGFFLDDMDHGIPLEFPASVSDCGDGSVWGLLEAARIQGINEFDTGFKATALKYADNSMVPTRAQIGLDKNTSGQYVSMPIVGIMLKPKVLRGGVHHMTGISLTMDGNATIQVKIYKSSNMGTPLSIVTMGGVSGTKVNHVFTTPIDLPFTDEFGNGLKYYFVYERTDNVLPRNNELTCGCTGGADISWTQSFEQWGGFQLANWDALNNGVTGSENRSMGIQIQGSVSCDTQQWMCMSDWDFSTNPFAAVISKVIQLTSINKLIGYLLQSSSVNRYTLMNREGLMSRYNMNRGAIESQMAWIGMNLSNYGANLSDCFTCKSNSIYSRASLLV